jgi:hypothetical protein
MAQQLGVCMEEIDNFLPLFYQDSILNTLLESNIDWRYVDGVAGTTSKVKTPKVKMSKDQTAFYHVAFRDGKPESHLFYALRPMIYALEDYLKRPLSDLSRIRVGLTKPSIYPGYHAPHVDFYARHKSLLYYVNDSDGDTVFYNEKFDGNTDRDSFTVQKRVKPKKGKAVLFDGFHYHSSGIPEKTLRRVVININYRVD